MNKIALLRVERDRVGGARRVLTEDKEAGNKMETNLKLIAKTTQRSWTEGGRREWGH